MEKGSVGMQFEPKSKTEETAERERLGLRKFLSISAGQSEANVARVQ